MPLIDFLYCLFNIIASLNWPDNAAYEQYIMVQERKSMLQSLLKEHQTLYTEDNR